jgi:hypothetical protein
VDWTDEHQACFEKLKELLSSDTVLAYFDPELKSCIVVDASSVGLGAIFTQETREGNRNVVCYASRTLTPVERRYSQIEREGLAIAWACDKFHLYLYGGPEFDIITDHKPLVPMFNNPRAQLPPRLLRWRLKMQQYKFSVRYNPGKENPADYMSRHPLETYSNHTQRLEESTEEYVNFIAINAVPKAITRHDVTIQKAIEAKRHSNWHVIIESTTDDPRISTAELKALHLCEQELTVNADESLLLHGTQLVLPASLPQRAIEIAHEGHQGMVKIKKLLREKGLVSRNQPHGKNLLKSCIPCQATVQTSPKSHNLYK